MRILHTETLKKWGGQQNRVLVEAEGLVRKGHKVVIACHRGSTLALRAKSAGITVYELNLEKRAHLTNIFRLLCIIRREDIQIVSTHSSVDSWAGGLAAKLSGRYHVRFRHNLYPIGRNPLSRLNYTMSNHIISISPSVKDALVACGLKGDKIKVIPSSVDTEAYNPSVPDIRSELGISPGDIVIGNTSTFTKVKGQETLFEAFNTIHKRLPCLLLLAGRVLESRKERLLSHMDQNLRQKVIFLGHRDDIPRVLKTIDVYAYPSYMEGLGTALIEAMAMERPVVVSDIATFRYFIEDGVNGVFFKPNDPGDMAEKILGIAAHVALRKELGKNARSTAVDRFSLTRMVEDTQCFYGELLGA